MASRPASMRSGDGDLALAREQLHRAHFAQIHAYRIVGAPAGSLASALAGTLCVTSTSSPPSASGSSSGARAALASRRLFGFDDVDAHLVEHRQDVFDLLGIDLFRQRLIWSWVTQPTLLGGADERLDRRVRQVEERAVRSRDFSAGVAPLSPASAPEKPLRQVPRALARHDPTSSARREPAPDPLCVSGISRQVPRLQYGSLERCAPTAVRHSPAM